HDDLPLAQRAAGAGATRSAIVSGRFNLLVLAQRAAYLCFSVFLLMLAQRVSLSCATRSAYGQG
ncbi:hypothetical protein A2U01_0109736, partial [Trifolium medium]|nr:hypothetical protein [Trifolium medium]